MTADECAALGRSIAEFQRGESSEGSHLVRYAKAYAERTGDADYTAAIRLFIHEEQRHARDLARFMLVNGLPLTRASVADALFRRLRNVAGTLEMSIGVLIVAELIAQVYYDALHTATGSNVLGRLCEQILRDEAQHVEFQAERLGMLRARRATTSYVATMLCQRLLFAGTCLVVWFVHRRAFRLAEFTYVRFWTDAWSCFNRAFDISAHARQVCRASPQRRSANATAL